MNDVLVAKGLSKEYPLPDGTLSIFNNLDFSLAEGELIAIMGVSGVGKTTLLNLFGALDRPNKGKVFIDGEDVFSKNEKDLAEMQALLDKEKKQRNKESQQLKKLATDQSKTVQEREKYKQLYDKKEVELAEFDKKKEHNKNRSKKIKKNYSNRDWKRNY